MKSLEKHEVFEMEVLDAMHRARLLDGLVFGGGTMLRLCFELKRYSTDLDFWVREPERMAAPAVKAMKELFRDMSVEITDAQEKRHTLLYEIRKEGFPQRLKIEIRKKPIEKALVEENIAFSPFASLQVRLKTFTLSQMWKNKILALLDRKIIRDAYDLEFLSRRGAGAIENISKEDLAKMFQIVEGFSKEDYRSVLGSVLPPDERDFYRTYRFEYLKTKIKAAL